VPSQESDLIALIGRLASSRVVCVGDLMLDAYVEGTVERVSPEAPVPVLAVRREGTMPGGAGNVAMNLAALGVGADVVGVVGDDPDGERLQGLLGSSGRLVASGHRRTTLKTRYLAAGQQLLRADRDDTAALSDGEIVAIADAAGQALDGAGALILSDYGKGVVCQPVIDAVLKAAGERGVPVVVDPKGTDFARYRGADVVTPNRAELSAASGQAVDDDDSAVKAARAIIDRCGIGAVLATRGEKGMTLVTPTAVHHLPAQAREVFDVVGAGDTVVAVFAAGLGAGAPLERAAELANIAAGLVVAKVGTAVTRPEELFTALQDSTLHSLEAKILPRASLIDRAEAWRRKGMRVGFTNGCFDILHPGHVSLLAQARAGGDRLIVGLNSDASVARLKGPDRPIQPQTSRAVVLASLSSVDAIVIFDEDTPLDLITTLRPDVLVKGADYSLDQVVGAAEMASWGGEVLLADIVDGHSTSATISRMNRRA